MIAHFVDDTGTSNVETNVKKKVTNTKTIPVNCKSLTQLVRLATTNTHKLVCLNINHSWAAKKIKTRSEDKSFK